MANNMNRISGMNRLDGFSRTSPFTGVTAEELRKLHDEAQKCSLNETTSSSSGKIESLEPSKIIQGTKDKRKFDEMDWVMLASEPQKELVSLDNNNNNTKPSENFVPIELPEMTEQDKKNLEIFMKQDFFPPSDSNRTTNRRPKIIKITPPPNSTLPSITQDPLDRIRGNLHSALVAMQDGNWGMGCVVLNKKARFSAHFNPTSGEVKIQPDGRLDENLTQITFRFKSSTEVKLKRKSLANELRAGISIQAAKILLVTERLLGKCHTFSANLCLELNPVEICDKENNDNKAMDSDSRVNLKKIEKWLQDQEIQYTVMSKEQEISPEEQRKENLAQITFTNLPLNSNEIKEQKMGIFIPASKVLFVTDYLVSTCHSCLIDICVNETEEKEDGVNNNNNTMEIEANRDKVKLQAVEKFLNDKNVKYSVTYKGNLDSKNIEKLLNDTNATEILSLWKQVNDRDVYPKMFDKKFLIGVLYQRNEVDESWNKDWGPDQIKEGEMLVVERSDKSLRFCCKEVISQKQVVSDKAQLNFGYKEFEETVEGKMTFVKHAVLNNFSKHELGLKMRRRW